MGGNFEGQIHGAEVFLLEWAHSTPIRMMKVFST